MGDRANVAFKESNGQRIWLYSHWGGSELPSELQEAMRFAEGRWNDEPYCIRSCVTRMTQNCADSLTGMGLSTSRMDNEHDVLEVDFKDQKVRVLSGEGWHDKWEGRVLKEWSFNDFCKLQIDGDAESLLELAEA